MLSPELLTLSSGSSAPSGRVHQTTEAPSKCDACRNSHSAASGLISSRNLFREDFQTGDYFVAPAMIYSSSLNPAAMDNLRLAGWRVLIFCKFLTNLNINLVVDCILGKPLKLRFQRYIVRTEILSTFHVRVKYNSVQNTPFCPFKPMGQIIPKQPLSFGARGPPSITLIPGPTTLTIPNGIQIHSAVLPQYTFWTNRETDRHTDRQLI